MPASLLSASKESEVPKYVGGHLEIFVSFRKLEPCFVSHVLEGSGVIRKNLNISTKVVLCNSSLVIF